jgi:hypothetical protein
VISEMPGMVLERYNACQVRRTVARRLQALVRLACCWRGGAFPSQLGPFLRSPSLTASSTLRKPSHPPQTVAFCGVFPDIKRAWASVDNSLFLWRFDKWCAPCLLPFRRYWLLASCCCRFQWC